MPNVLASKAQNQSHIPPKVLYPEIPTHVGKRTRDESSEHESDDERSPVFKKPFIPWHRSTATPPESAVRTTKQTIVKVASVNIQGRQPFGPHTQTKRLQRHQSRPSELRICRLGPVIPPTYLTLPGFNDPSLFADIRHTSP